MTDTHAHLNDPQFTGRIPEVLDRAREHGVLNIIVCGWDIPSSSQAIALANSNECIFAITGVHPHDSRIWSQDSLGDVRRFVCENKVVGIGEVGLDYHYDLDFKEAQEICFRQQLELALETGLPVSVHSREAMKDTIAILRDYEGLKGVLHFFTGDRDDLKTLLDMGFYIGVDGPLTFKSSDPLREVIQYAPLQRILLETDCPYMAPVPFRGKICEPYMIEYILERLSAVLEQDKDYIRDVIDANTYALFGIRP